MSNTSSGTKPGTNTKTRTLYASCRADFLHVLQPFVQHARMMTDARFIDGNLFVEPASTGGILIGAVTGTAMAILHDPDGYCSSAAVLDIPDAAFEAAKPVEPLHMTYCGECYGPDVPEWMQPGTATFHDAGMWIAPKMRHPQWAEEDDEFMPMLYARTASVKHHSVGSDFRMKAGTPVDWKPVLAKAVSTPPSLGSDTTVFMPQLADLYSRIVEMCMDDAFPKSSRVFHRATRIGEKPGPIIITIEDRSDFVGTYMPMQDGIAQPVSWHFLHREKANG